MSKNIYIPVLIWSLFSTAAVYASVKSAVQICAELISSLEKPRKVPTPVHPSENKDYQNYLRGRARNPRVIPPAAMLEKNTPDDDLKFSFFFWWYPGNVFGKLMLPGNEALAAHLLAGGKLSDHLVPTAKQLEAEAEARAEQPILAEEKPAEKPAGAAPPAPPGDVHEEHLETSPTKHADHAAPAATSDPSAGFTTDSGPGPSNGTP